ncbi:MAG TPA: glycosyltransferase family 4 protein [Gaiellaceae bacterium]|nr:glycosyltransferase family 4 protein [Gaiellaceae bacterium]
MTGGPRRLLLVPSAYHPNVGGIEEVTRRLARGFRARGAEVLVVTNRWPDSTASSEEVEGIPVRRIGFHLPAASARSLARMGLRAPGSAGGFVRLVRSFRPHVLQIVGAGPNAAYVAALRPLLRTRVVLGTHGELSGDAHDVFRRSSTLRLALRALCRSADAVTAPSRFTLEELRDAYTVRGAAEVIPNGVDVGELAGAEPRTDLGPYVLSVGRLVPQKGFDVALRSFRELRSSHGSHRLVLAGEGPARPHLEREIERLGLQGAVVLLGSVGRDALPGLYAGAAAVVLASRREAFGLAALEAMAAGAPLVATTVGGIPEFAPDGEAALLVPPDDPAALAAALRRALDDSELRERLTANASRQAASYSWERVVDRHEALYERVLARPRQPSASS